MREIKELPTSDLLVEALGLSKADATSDERWECVRELHHRGEPQIFEAAKNWCASSEVTEKLLAADILAQLGPLRNEGGDDFRPFTILTIPLLGGLLDDPDARVVLSAVQAFGHSYVWDPIAKKASLALHPSELVRKEVARVLGTCKASPAAINILIQLSQDQDDDVRDWATFGLGSQCRLDTPAIREALFARVMDNHPDTKWEALVGLAKRNDERVVPFIKAGLEAESVGNLQVEAAGEIASSELSEPLEALLECWDADDADVELLRAALKRCRGEASPDDEWRWDNHATGEA